MQELLDCLSSYIKELDSKLSGINSKIAQFEKFASSPDLEKRISYLKGSRDTLIADKELFEDYYMLAKQLILSAPASSPFPTAAGGTATQEQTTVGSVDPESPIKKEQKKLPNISNIMQSMPGIIKKHTD